MKVIIDNKEYELNVEKAQELKLLTPTKPKLTIKDMKVGTRFKCNGPTNDLVLMQCIGNPYIGGKDRRCYNLFGFKYYPNSNEFYQSLHTLDECLDYLNDKEFEVAGYGWEN
jgi:hypothetical protein